MAQAAGGVDRYIRMLLKYLDKEKFENILVCSQDFNREDYDGLVDSFEQIEMNRAIGVSDLNSIKEVRRLIKKYNPDYSYAQRTVNIVLTMCSAVTAIFLPRLSYYYDNEKAVFYKLMDKGFQILCLGVVPLAVGLFLTANQAVVLLYGDSFTPTGTTIKLMCPLILIKGFGDLLCYQLAYSSKNEYILLPGSAIASIINVITNSILIPLYAQNGAVIASVMSELTTNIIQFLYLKRKIKYHISNTALVLSLFSTMVMAAVVCAIIKMNLPLAVALAMEISIGGAIYLLMNIALKNRILSEMLTKVLKKHNTGFQDS